MEHLTLMTPTETMASWAGLAIVFPQTHPQTLDQIAEYTTTYGKPADSPETTPWSYADPSNPETPATFTVKPVAMVGEYFNPVTGQVYPYGARQGDPFDPTQMDPRPKIYERV